MKKIRDIRSFFKPTKPSEVGENIGAESLTFLAGGDEENSLATQTEQQPLEDHNLPQHKITDLGTKETGAQQPKINFKKTFVGGQNRSFSAKFYDRYAWLEYSVELQKAFCFVCRNFGIQSSREQNEKFVVSGFDMWKKLGQALEKHDRSQIHSQCGQAYAIYTQSSKNVHSAISQQYAKQIEENRLYLQQIIDLVLVLARQGIDFRGHRESKNSINRGNFLEIATNIAKYDSEFRKNFNKLVNYCSPTIQNEIIDISANIVTKIIIEAVKECGFFSLMVDEARCFKEEQLSITIRFVKHLEVHERFLGFVDCSVDRDASSLRNLIVEFLDEKGLAGTPIVGQSFDGANVMSGFKGGLQAKIKESNPQAIFIHCLAHRLNLVIVDSCLHIPSASTLFNSVEALFSHFSRPGNHSGLKRISKELQIKNLEIRSLSTTRWSCRYENCKSIINNYTSIKNALEEESIQFNDKNAVEALCLLAIISKPDFVVSLFIFRFALQLTNVLNKFFQTENATLGESHEIVTSTINTFKESRTKFDEIWKEIEPLRVSKRKKRSCLKEDFHVETSLGKSKYVDLPDDTSAFEYWKINIFYTVVDNITTNLEYRFQSVPFAKSVNAFNKLVLEEATEFIDHYKTMLKLDCDALKAEAIVVKNILKTEYGDNSITIDMLKKKVGKEMFPNMYKILQVALSLPISSAGCERSFSAMRRIKTWLRSTMVQDRFSNLAILNIENELVKNDLSSEDVLKKFSEKNRQILYK